MKSLSQQIQELTHRLDHIQLEGEFEAEIDALLESILLDESTLLQISGGDIQGKNLARYVHRFHKANDRANWEEVPLTQHFKWEENFKEFADNMLLMQGNKGWAMFKASPEYQRLDKEAGTKKGNASDNQQPYEYYVAIGDKVLSDEEIDADIGSIEVDRGYRGVSGSPKSTANYVRTGTTRGGKAANQKDPRNPANMFDKVREMIGPKIVGLWVAREREDLSAVRSAMEPKKQEVLNKLGLANKPSDTWSYLERDDFEKEMDKVKAGINLGGGKAGKKYFGKSGASRTSGKILARRPEVKPGGQARVMIDRLWKIAPKILNQVLIRMERKDADSKRVSEVETALDNYNPSQPNNFFLQAVNGIFDRLSPEVQASIGQGDVMALKGLIPQLRDELEKKYTRGY